MRTLLHGITALVLIVNIPHVFGDAEDGGAESAYHKMASGDLKAEISDGMGRVFPSDDPAFKFVNQVHEMLNGVKKADDVKKMLPDINMMRRTLAKATNISNMAKLSWDTNLASKASTNDCQDFTGPNFRSFKFHTSMTTDKDDKFHIVPAQWLFSSFGSKEPNTLELAAPHQNLIGCAQKGCLPMQADKADMKKFEYVCVLGPSSINAENGIHKGAAGSNCGNGINDDGLCDMGGKASSGASSGDSGVPGAPKPESGASTNQTVTGSSNHHFIGSALLIFTAFLIF